MARTTKDDVILVARAFSIEMEDYFRSEGESEADATYLAFLALKFATRFLERVTMVAVPEAVARHAALEAELMASLDSFWKENQPSRPD